VLRLAEHRTSEPCSLVLRLHREVVEPPKISSDSGHFAGAEYQVDPSVCLAWRAKVFSHSVSTKSLCFTLKCQAASSTRGLEQARIGVDGHLLCARDVFGHGPSIASSSAASVAGLFSAARPPARPGGPGAVARAFASPPSAPAAWLARRPLVGAHHARLPVGPLWSLGLWPAVSPSLSGSAPVRLSLPHKEIWEKRGTMPKDCRLRTQCRVVDGQVALVFGRATVRSWIGHPTAGITTSTITELSSRLFRLARRLRLMSGVGKDFSLTI
jgi:hypothetical protein